MRALRRLLTITLAVSLAGAAAVSAGPSLGSGEPAGATTKPNIVLVKVDDMTYDELTIPGVMPRLLQRFANTGTTFERYYVSISLCCPDRAATLSGQYGHNNKIQNNNSYKYFAHGNTVAKWLQAEGYYTSLIGKYMNGYSCTKAIPAGWTDWQGLCKSYYSMFGYSIRDNATTVTYGRATDDYQTDVIADRMVETVDAALASDKPFFLYVTPTAPHGGGGTRAAPRHANAFSTWKLPIKPNFNEANVSDKPTWVRNLSAMTNSQVKAIEKSERIRLQMLRAVDDLMEDLYQKLVATGQLANTVVMFTSDNGFMRGEHRIRQSKEVWYEESTRQPLVMSGPGVPVGVSNGSLVMNVDLAPTITALAGATPGRTYDGESILPKLTDPTLGARRVVVHVQVPDETPDIVRGTGVRTMFGLKYLKLESGEEEMYDLNADPFELANVAAAPAYADAKNDLATISDLAKACAGAACRNRIPLPSFSASCDANRVCTLDASASSDDGSIVGYAWRFPGGATATGITTTRTFAQDGTYAVRLRVTDDRGWPWTVTLPVVVDGRPSASFTSNTDGLDLTVDAAASADPGGGIATYAWDFGDGATGTGVTASHTFAVAGTYTVALSVTDTGGNTTTTSRSVTVSAPPTASFGFTLTGSDAAFDGSGSSDDIGITAFNWDFGDGESGTGMSPTHTYAGPGSYTVTLTVIDEIGQQDSTTLEVVVT